VVETIMKTTKADHAKIHSYKMQAKTNLNQYYLSNTVQRNKLQLIYIYTVKLVLFKS